MKQATVDLETFSDADFAMVFRWQLSDDPPSYFDFTDHKLLMHVRKTPEDAEVFIHLSSDNLDEIDIYGEVGEDELTYFAILIAREQMTDMAAGEYVHSLIMVTPAGLHEDLWRGTLTHDIGPTR